MHGRKEADVIISYHELAKIRQREIVRRVEQRRLETDARRPEPADTRIEPQTTKQPQAA